MPSRAAPPVTSVAAGTPATAATPATAVTAATVVATVRGSPDPTRSLTRSVALLRLLCGHGQHGWRISDLARQSGLDLATTHRLLAGLAAGGLVTRVPGTRNYALGPFAWQLGLAAAPWFEPPTPVQTRLRAAARALGGTLFLKVRSDRDSVCIARHDGAATDRALLLDVGGRRPLCLTAGGVAMLLRLPAAEQRAIEAENLRRLAGQGREKRAAVRQMLARSRQWGFGVNLGDMSAGIHSIACLVPWPTDPARVAASLSLAVAGPPPRAEQVRAIAARLTEEGVAVGGALARQRC